MCETRQHAPQVANIEPAMNMFIEEVSHVDVPLDSLDIDASIVHMSIKEDVLDNGNHMSSDVESSKKDSEDSGIFVASGHPPPPASSLADPKFQALFDSLPSIVQKAYDPLIQKFWIPAYVKNPIKGQKKFILKMVKQSLCHTFRNNCT